MVRRMLCWFAGFALVTPLLAQADETSRVILVQIVFRGERLEAGAVERVPGRARNNYGIPQLAPVFYEVVGGQGEVLYAGEIGTPVQPSFWAQDPETGKLVPVATEVEDPRLVLRIPDLTDAKELMIYRRVSEDPESGRSLLLRTGL